MESHGKYHDIAFFAAGCFWGVEETFRTLEGVVATRVGYMGGTAEHPRYTDVCSGRTGHAETVGVRFDPATLSYDQLLDAFWSCHDPTTPDRQGADIGSQYRSVIFFRGAYQERLARASKQKMIASGRWRVPLVTDILPASVFWPAESYHQHYLQRHGRSECRV